jgi:enolase
LRSNEEAITVILEAIGQTGYKAGSDIMLHLTVHLQNFTKMVNIFLQVKAIKHSQATNSLII